MQSESSESFSGWNCATVHVNVLQISASVQAPNRDDSAQTERAMISLQLRLKIQSKINRLIIIFDPLVFKTSENCEKRLLFLSKTTKYYI